MLQGPKNRTGLPRSARKGCIPRNAVVIDTSISVVLAGLGIYHFTQPHQAWRSGVIEVIASISLLVAAYCLSRLKAMVVNLLVAAPIFILGIRHVIHGGGWLSGIAELLFAVLLIRAAGVIRRAGES